MRKKVESRSPLKGVRNRIVGATRLTAIAIVFSLMQLPAYANAQQRLSIEMRGASLENILWALQKQSNITFFYSVSDVAGITSVDAVFSDALLDDILNKVLDSTQLSYKIQNNTVVISRREVAQQPTMRHITVTGTIKDTQGDPIHGATVQLDGTGTGTTSGVDGRFSITIPDDGKAVLRFSYVGMTTRAIPYTESPMLVILDQDTTEIEEVLVTGMGSIRKDENAGSRADFDFDKNAILNPVTGIEDALKGKLAGLSIQSQSGLVGSRPKIRIRGTSTLLSNPDPVWVVDGIIQDDPVPFNMRDFGNMADNFDMIRDFVGNSIAWLNPRDIDNITILKDAAATVLYGVKAANGVIVITTKRGEDTNGKANVSYSGGFSISEKLSYDKMNLMNSKERIDVSREITKNHLLGDRANTSAGYEKALSLYLSKQIDFATFNGMVKRMETMNTDWMDILYRNPISHNHNVGVSGGTSTVRYYASLNYGNTKGIARGNDSENYGANFSLNTNIGKKITLDMRMSGSINTTSAFFSSVDPFNYAVNTSRTIPAYEDNGEPAYYDLNGVSYNILNELAQTGNDNESRTISTSLSMNYNIMEGLLFTSTFGYNSGTNSGRAYATERSNYIAKLRGYDFGEYVFGDTPYRESEIPHGGELNQTDSRNSSITWRNQLSWNRVFGDKHRVSASVGQEIRSTSMDGFESIAYGYLPDRGQGIIYPDPIVGSYDSYTDTWSTVPNTLFNKTGSTIRESKSNFVSFYGSAAYSYNERYVITGSLRTDASNRFGQNKKDRFQPVWSVGLRWNVLNEAWAQNQNLLSELNVRSSFGYQGNVAENYGPELVAYRPDPVMHPVMNEYQLRIQTLAYGDLRWEKTRSFNVGVDMGFLKNRFTATVEYYNNLTSDMIVMREVPKEYGTSRLPVNGGRMSNKGVELSVNGTLIRSRNITWSMSANTAKNLNRVESDMTTYNNWQQAVSGEYYKNGYAASSFWLFDFAGLDPNVGTPTFNKIVRNYTDMPYEWMNDPTLYMTYAGTLDPDLTGGFSTSFRYKTFSLSAAFNWAIGGKRMLSKIFSDNAQINELKFPDPFNNLTREYVDRWRQPGDEKFTDIPTIPSGNDPGYGNPIYLDDVVNGETIRAYEMYDNSTARVVNGSYMKCSGISLGYSFTDRVLDALGVQALSMNVQVSNPFSIVSREYKGIDPEVATGGQPLARSFTFGVNVSF